MAEFFETKIENLEKSIPPSIPSRNKKNKKGFKKRKAVTLSVSEDEDLDKEQNWKMFANTKVRVGLPWINALRSRHWLGKQKRRRGNKDSKNKISYTKHEVYAMVQKKGQKKLKKEAYWGTTRREN